MPEVTFRDFAMAVMQNQQPAAAAHLQTLLGLSELDALAATTHFKARSADPAFMPKAMSLRTAVTSGTDAEINELLADCFGLAAAQQATGLAAIRASYPRPA
ncbi:MAG: hypothetical protein ABI678_13470 [Kofleriaceae bacterium]